jgi:WD40 repeat protein
MDNPLRLQRWIVAGTMILGVTAALGQPPAKPPALPAIDPGQARLGQTLAGLDGPGVAIASGEASGNLAAADEEGTIRFWTRDMVLGVRTADLTPHVWPGHKGPITALAWNGGPVVASSGVDQHLMLWSFPDGAALHTVTSTDTLRALAMSPDGKLVAGAGEDPSIRVWDVATGKLTATLTGHADWVQCLGFSPDGKILASGGQDRVVRLWDVVAAKEMRQVPAQPPPPANTPPGPANIVLALAFSPDGKQLALGGTDTQVHLANVADGKLVRSLPGHGGAVTALTFHPGGTLLISASKDRTVRLWNPTNGQAIKVLEGHTAWVQGLTPVAQGTRLASVGADRTVRLWELR